MRRVIAFSCQGETLLGTLDEAPGTTGLLIVSGGNEVRAGAHRGMALLAGRVAAAGHPVFRFDRRGIGDSGGENGGWTSSLPDLRAAIETLHSEQPHLSRLVALGNCDAATLLASAASQTGIDALILTNPWAGDDTDGLPSASAIRRRYAERLRDPRQWRRALSGGVDFALLFRGLRKLLHPPAHDTTGRMAAGLARFPGPVTLVLAEGDATALGFRAHWSRGPFTASRTQTKLIDVPTASHSFQHAADAAALECSVLAALRQAQGERTFE